MLITLFCFRDPWEAHLFRTRLEAEDIPVFVANDLHIWNNWPISTALGGVRLQIPASLVPQAQAVWQRCIAGEYEAALVAEFGPINYRECPVCGSKEIRRRPRLRDIVFGLALAFFAISPFSTPKCHCRTCGANWIET
jgi:hypothetical protein